MTDRQQAKSEYEQAKQAVRKSTIEVNEAQVAQSRAEKILRTAQDNLWDANIRLRQARERAVEVGV